MKEHNCVLNILQAGPGEILDRDAGHIIQLDREGRVAASFSNETSEPEKIRITLTALRPHAMFEIRITGEPARNYRANAAGILEFSEIVPAEGQMVFLEKKL
ncbi:MAG: hypothetical protein ACOX8B_04035 [Lachnospiraceae bacterium]|jgi:hypothetical protein